ncbi:MAG: 1,4-alpha-glucan branching enzyme [Lachnospiraceae bacterium]|nr:1,4-alpha-glucan branching enzyme [Lachnospiraceae bacterium]
MTANDFFQGNVFDAYEYFGAHVCRNESGEEQGVWFRVFAPNASKVALLGECNGWEELIMNRCEFYGVFQCFCPEARTGQRYQYRIWSQNGTLQDHADPYGFGMEVRPAWCSIIRDLNEYSFGDQEWMQNRTVCTDRALNIYEIHAGSWKKPDWETVQTLLAGNSQETEGILKEEGCQGESRHRETMEKGMEAGERDPGAAQWYPYLELADHLIPYLLENHYTHVEFMPLAEHPYDGSWGYQQTGFFAPTSRYGTAKELQYLIDHLHQAGIGVIMDFVPVHFATDNYGLKEFDGTCLYEYPNDAVGFSEWGSANFIHSRKEVWCFIQSAANYWLEKYHVDGLRFDAVSRLIYWQGSEHRGVNNTTLEFLKHLNQGLKERHPTAMLIAEDSTSYPGVTRSVWENGLGFDYKWDLGWMHDTLEYFQTPPEYRTRDYHKLTFSMMYYYNEKYLLEFSHDEVVHGKATILQKMYGDYDIKFPQGRGLYLYMMMHPGKKLNFMGSELGQLREWDEKKEQDWMLRTFPLHDSFYRYIQELNRIYMEYVCLHKDYDGENFKWLDCHQEERCIYTILRQHYGNKSLAAIFNFSAIVQENYQVLLPSRLSARLILNSDWEQYGGRTRPGQESWRAENVAYGVELTVSIPAFSGIVFETE